MVATGLQSKHLVHGVMATSCENNTSTATEKEGWMAAVVRASIIQRKGEEKSKCDRSHEVRVLALCCTSSVDTAKCDKYHSDLWVGGKHHS